MQTTSILQYPTTINAAGHLLTGMPQAAIFISNPYQYLTFTEPKPSNGNIRKCIKKQTKAKLKLKLFSFYYHFN